MIPLCTSFLKSMGGSLSLMAGSSAGGFRRVWDLESPLPLRSCAFRNALGCCGNSGSRGVSAGLGGAHPPFSRSPRGQAGLLRYAGVGVCRYHGKGALVGHILPQGGSALGIREGGCG